MADFTLDPKHMDRRGFLKGSAWAAAAMGLAAALPASAQDQKPADPAKPEEPGPDEPKKEDAPRKKLLDKNGREYRVCDMCGGNMYQEGKTWTCEQCGYSYEE